MKKLVVLGIIAGVAVASVIATVGVRTVRRIDRQWSEPSTRTALIGAPAMNRGVGLVELHRARFGRYPGVLSDLRFLSNFDRAELGWLEYAAGEDGNTYYIALAREIPGADAVAWPDEYWAGTGYDPSLRSAAARVKLPEVETPASVGGGFADLTLAGVNLAVGQVELHRLRFGRYPDTLDDLRYLAGTESGRVLGQSAAAWRNPSLAVVEYTLGDDGRSYDILVKRPLGGTAPAGVPEEYWRGTGRRAGG
jgi:hypothetical protein